MTKASFVSQKIFSEKVVSIHEINPFLTFDGSIYVEYSILDSLKLLMYECHYKYIKVKGYNMSNLLFTDTGSLVCKIQTESVYEYFYEDITLLDFSDYPRDSKFLILPIGNWLLKGNVKLTEK